jgi:gluconolactonase
MERRQFLAGAAALGATAFASRRALARDWSDPASTRYPDPDIEIVDKRFSGLVVGNTNIERLWNQGLWSEGPVWFGDGRYLVWSDIANDRIMRWDEDDGHVSEFRKPSHNSNGATRDREGRLINCEQDTRRVTRTEHDGRITVLIDRFDNKPLNSPNDVVVHSDGGIWFTDPGYGISGDYEGHRASFELPRNVYRLDPQNGRATVVASDFTRPNGLCFSPDETRLYICDTGLTDGPDNPAHIRVFDVADATTLRNGRIFHDFKPSFADGIRADVDGNIWAGVGWGDPKDYGVWCLGPDGVVLGKIHLPEICANVCFGGAKQNRLFMAASRSLYAVYVNTRGALVA